MESSCLTTPWVSGASCIGAARIASSTQARRPPSSSILPLSANSASSHVEMGDSHGSVAGDSSASATPPVSREGACRLRIQMGVSGRSLAPPPSPSPRPPKR